MIKTFWDLGKCSILHKLGNRQLTQYPSKKNSSWNLHIVLGWSAFCLPKLANILQIFYPSSAASFPKIGCCSSDRTLPRVGSHFSVQSQHVSAYLPWLLWARLGSPPVCTTPYRSLKSSCIQSVVLMSGLCILQPRVLLQCMASHRHSKPVHTSTWLMLMSLIALWALFIGMVIYSVRH